MIKTHAEIKKGIADVSLDGSPAMLCVETGVTLWTIYAAIRDKDRSAGQKLKDYIVHVVNSDQFWDGDNSAAADKLGDYVPEIFRDAAEKAGAVPMGFYGGSITPPPPPGRKKNYKQ